MKLLGSILVNALAFYLLSYLLPGFSIEGYQAILVTAIVWGLISVFIRPIIKLLTLPINIVTLGLFSFVINAALLLFTARIVNGFDIDTFTTALIGAVLLAITSSFLNSLLRD